MSADDEKFDALGWAARSLAWERRLRELEEPPPAQPRSVVAPNVEADIGRRTLSVSAFIFKVRLRRRAGSHAPAR